MSAEMIEIGNVMAYPYTKKGDEKGKVRYRLLQKVVINGKICQLNGTLTSIKTTQ